MRQLADAIGMPPNRISDMVRQQWGVTTDTAIRLGRYFGTDPRFWLNMQQGYELSKAETETETETVTDESSVPARAA